MEESPVFASLDARKAITMAINKQALLQHDQNRGEVATGFWSPENQCYNADFEALPYDPEQARSLIESAGVAGQEVELVMAAPGTLFPTDGWAPLLQQDIEQAGLKVKVTSLAFDAWLSRTMDPLAIVPNGWSMDVPHGSSSSTRRSDRHQGGGRRGGPAELLALGLPEVDELNATGNATTDKEEEISAYQQIMRTVIGEEALWVTVYWPQRSLYRGDNVQNLLVERTPRRRSSRSWPSPPDPRASRWRRTASRLVLRRTAQYRRRPPPATGLRASGGSSGIRRPWPARCWSCS